MGREKIDGDADAESDGVFDVVPTTYVYRPNGGFERVVRCVDRAFGTHLDRRLQKRPELNGVSSRLVVCQTARELLSIASRCLGKHGRSAMANANAATASLDWEASPCRLR